MASLAAQLLLRDDAEILTKALKISLGSASDGGATPAPSPRAPSSSEPPLELAELAAELKAEAGDATGAEAVAARWADVASRRSLFDRALVGRLSDAAHCPVVDYLISSFVATEDLRARKGGGASAELVEVYEYVSELCVSYASIALLNPSMFPQPADAESEGVLRLLRPLRDDTLPAKFLSRLVAKFAEEGSLAELALPLFARLAEDAAKVSLAAADFGPYRALHKLLSEKPLAALFGTDASFLSPLVCRTGALLQAGSRLGPFFGLSCFPSELAIATQCFPDPSGNPGSLEQSMTTFRSASKIVHNALFAISRTLLGSPESKEPFFRFVAAACSLNGARSQQWFPHAEGERIMRQIAPEQFTESPPQPRTYSHDGFMFNLGAVLLQLCEPFTPPDSPKAKLIDSSFLLSEHRLSLKEETRLCATKDDVMHWLDPRNPDLRQRYLDRLAADGLVDPDAEGAPPLEVSSNFGTISEFFFLTMRVLHVGIHPSFNMLEQLMKDHGKHDRDLRIREAELMRLRAGGANPAVAAQMEAEATMMKKWLEGMKRCILCYQTQLGDPTLVMQCVRYYRLVARWLVATANPDSPRGGLPLPDKVPRLFAALPEFCMSDIADFLKNITHLAPQAFEMIAPDELHDFLTLMVTFIGAPKYVKNPYLRATFTKLLCYLVPRTDDETGRRHASERLAGIFHSHALAQRHLAPAVMQFFVDIEFSGSHTGAYDKYEYRHEMAQVLEYFWQQPVYKATMVEFARDLKRFVRFVNMLINDSIYAMNEALSKLKTIKDVQAEMADEAAWAQQTPRVRQQRQSQLQQDEGHARYFMLFTNEVMHMMSYLSSDKEVALVFMLPELAPRISEMLNHFLVDLVGPKCSNLKVRDPEKYNFHPKELLHKIVTIMLNFAPFPEFEQAMVRDERSFDPGNLRKAVRVLSRSATDLTVRPEHMQALEAFATRCVEAKEEMAAAEEELGEVPDEFQDPITADLMADPVRLPSGHSIDRAVITRHLLSDETDPFSRQRLTVEMLVDDTELKAKIEAWKAEQRRKSASGSGTAVPMEEG